VQARAGVSYGAPAVTSELAGEMLMGGEMAAPEVRVEPQVRYTTVLIISFCLQTVHGSTDQLIFELCGSLDVNGFEVVMEFCDI
jgi:hypothetical protein